MRIKITKLGHSCLLVETDDRVALFDPGKWSDVKVEDIQKLDRLIITHEHGDHMDLNKIKELVDKFSDVKIICNPLVAKVISKEMEAEITQESNCVKPFIAPHESLPVPGVEPPESTGYHFKNVFTHPGDSHSFNESKDILALPIVGPWANPVKAIDLALKLKPKYLILIHDWHLSREGFDWYQDVARDVCKSNNIDLIRVNNNEAVEVEL